MDYLSGAIVHEECIMCHELIGFGEKKTVVEGGLLCSSLSCESGYAEQIQNYEKEQVKKAVLFHHDHHI
jgi:hypothetical protein